MTRKLCRNPSSTASSGSAGLGQAVMPFSENLFAGLHSVYPLISPTSNFCIILWEASPSGAGVASGMDRLVLFATQGLIFGGAAAKYPDIRWIFSHSGGVTPFLLSRFVRQEADLKDKAKAVMPNGALHELKKFYYDPTKYKTYLEQLGVAYPPPMPAPKANVTP